MFTRRPRLLTHGPPVPPRVRVVVFASSMPKVAYLSEQSTSISTGMVRGSFPVFLKTAVHAVLTNYLPLLLDGSLPALSVFGLNRSKTEEADTGGHG